MYFSVYLMPSFTFEAAEGFIADVPDEIDRCGIRDAARPKCLPNPVNLILLHLVKLHLCCILNNLAILLYFGRKYLAILL